jgi:Flp pilus assembly protein TadD
MAVLKNVLATHPSNRDALSALVSYSRDNGDIRGALTYANQLAALSPNDSRLKALIESLKGQIEEQNAN